MRNKKNCIICQAGVEEACKKYPAIKLKQEQIDGLCKVHYLNYRCATGQCGGGGGVV